MKTWSCFDLLNRNFSINFKVKPVREKWTLYSCLIFHGAMVKVLFSPSKLPHINLDNINILEENKGTLEKSGLESLFPTIRIALCNHSKLV